MQANAANVVMPTITYDNQRYSTLNQITAQNVGKLQVAWTFSTGVLRGHEGAPLVIGDVMYVHAPFPNTVFALDLNHDGKILWKYEPKQDPNVIPVMCCDTVNRGVAYADGKLFLHQADTTLVALDAKTGKVVWSVKTGDPGKGETGTGAPMVVKDKVYVGVSGGEFGVRGWVTAYSTADGKQVWRAYSEGPDSDMLVDPQKTTSLGKPIGADFEPEDLGRRSVEDRRRRPPGAGLSYDPKLNLIYYGSGNPSTWNPKQRPGDNKWSMTIFARDADTGMAKWVYQMTPHDEWDYDGVNEMILADQEIGGQTVPTLVHFDRNGLRLHAEPRDRRAAGRREVRSGGELDHRRRHEQEQQNYGRPNVVDEVCPGRGRRGREPKGICPAALGSKDEQPAAYSPETKLFYVPTNHVCMDYEPFRVSYTAGQPYVGATLSMYPPPGQTNMGNFIAWDADQGQDRVVRSGAVLGLVGRAGDQGRRGVLRHAGGLPEGGRCEDRQGAVQVQDAVRHHRQRDDL